MCEYSVQKMHEQITTGEFFKDGYKINILTGLWRRPATYIVFQCVRSSIRDSVLITPYFII